MGARLAAALMNVLKQLWQTTLGRKYLMAGTGCLLVFFVVGHMVGNLQVFLGREVINAYGAFLHSKPLLLWGVRVGLLTLVGVHIWSAIALAGENQAARPVPYAGNPAPVAASYASRTMVMSGLIIAAFVVYHLLHFTVQVDAVNLTGQAFGAMTDTQGRQDVFGMMVVGFSHPLVAGFYVLAMALLCMHLSHGVSAMFQSVGWRSCCPRVIEVMAKVSAALIFLGYVSIPVAIGVFKYGAGK